MKILVVSAYYPPHHIGGYELGCRDVVHKLRERGHAVEVLTSDFRHENCSLPEEPGVWRELHRATPAGPPPKTTECRKLARVLHDFKPDLVYFWSQSELCYWMHLYARSQGYHTVFFLSDTNFVSWRIAAWLLGAANKSRIIRTLFGSSFLVRGWPVIANRPCHFCSDFIRQTAVKHGIPFAPRHSVVAHWGIEPDAFQVPPRERWPVRRLLYAGQMIPQKGVHTAITAFAQVAKEKGFEDLTLSLAGGGMHLDYERQLQAMPEKLGVSGRVRFLGKVPRAELPRVYAEHDVLVFPSEWDEPFAITPLEAIHCGLAVVGTTTGGSGELFRNRETAMTFRAGDAADCARAIRELCADRELLQRITRNAQREMREKHTLDAMVDQIEASLLNLTSES